MFTIRNYIQWANSILVASALSGEYKPFITSYADLFFILIIVIIAALFGVWLADQINNRRNK